jgi:hypothetical protein
MVAGAIYSKDEIDRKINALDGMSIRGLLSSTTALPTTNV